MNRRGFLKALGIGTAAVATGAIALLDQELWTPKRTFFLPPGGGWGGNQLLTISQITNEALRILSSEMHFTTGDVITIGGVSGQFVVRDSGYHVRISRPARYAPELNQMVSRWQA